MIHAAQSGQSGPPLVFLHGVGGDHRCFAPQSVFFHQNYRVYALDLPGYGGSTPLAEMTMEGLAAAVLTWIDATLDEKPHLVGHSFGGMVAQELISQRPDAVRSLILSGTSPAFGGKGGEFQKKFIADRTRPLDEGKSLAELAPILVPNLLGPNPDPAAAPAMIETMSAISSDTYRQAVACIASFDKRENLAHIAVPTYCIAASEDNTAPAKMMERMAEKIPGAQFDCIEGAGHLANLEDPDAFNALLADYLEKH